jgi:hypothetical protein
MALARHLGEVVGTVGAIFALACIEKDKRLCDVKPALWIMLDGWLHPAQALWNEKAERYLTREEPVYLDGGRLPPTETGRFGTPSYCQLAMELGELTSKAGLLSGQPGQASNWTMAKGFADELRRYTGAENDNDAVAAIHALIPEIQCEARRGIDRWRAETEAAAVAEQWIPVAEAERLTEINRGTLSRAAKQGKIKTNGQTGRKLQLDLADVKRFSLQAKARRNERENREVLSQYRKDDQKRLFGGANR